MSLVEDGVSLSKSDDPDFLERFIPLRRISRELPELRNAGRGGKEISYHTWLIRR